MTRRITRILMTQFGLLVLAGFILSRQNQFDLRVCWAVITFDFDNLIFRTQSPPDFGLSEASVSGLSEPFFHWPATGHLFGSTLLFVPWWIALLCGVCGSAAIVWMFRPRRIQRAAFPMDSAPLTPKQHPRMK